jgi:hypothetical protein
MSDCTNVGIRELLPEYLHGGVAAEERDRVDAHLASCADCSAELSLLRSVRDAWSHSPVPDVGAIVRALPPPRAHRAVRFSALRIAAAISFISLGGISLSLARSFFQGDARVVTLDSTLPVAVDSGGKGEGAMPGTVAVREISFGGGVSDLATEDIQSLLSALESLEAAPPVEPEEPVAGSGRSGSGA